MHSKANDHTLELGAIDLSIIKTEDYDLDLYN